MLIPITITPKGEITFDENLVCSNAAMRNIFNKYGRSGVAYVVFYADIESPYYDLNNEELKITTISYAVGLDVKKATQQDIKDACKELEEVILSTTVGIYLKGFQTKMQQFGKSMIYDELTDENRSDWIEDMKKGGGLNKVLDDIKQQYRNTQDEVRSKFKLKGGKTTGTEAEQRALDMAGVKVSLNGKK